MPEHVTASIVAGSGLLAQIIARIRCVTKPDEEGHCFIASGCTEHQLLASHELDVQKFDLHGAEVIVMTKS